MSYLETLIAETFGVPVDDPKVRGVVKALYQAGAIDRLAIARLQIMADPCRDYKIVMRRYHVPQVFVYRVWRSCV